MVNQSRDSVTGARVYDAGAAPDTAADLTQISKDAFTLGTRPMGTTAEREAYEFKRKGLRWFDTTLNADMIYTGTGWQETLKLDTGWQSLTLINGWTNYGNGSEAPVWRVKNGFLFMAGRITGGASASAVFAVLPPEARHTVPFLMVFRTHIDNAVAGVTVARDGSCATFDPASGMRSGVSLAPISYPVG